MKKALLALFGVSTLLTGCNVEQRTVTQPKEEKAAEEKAPEKGAEEAAPEKGAEEAPEEAAPSKEKK